MRVYVCVCVCVCAYRKKHRYPVYASAQYDLVYLVCSQSPENTVTYSIEGDSTAPNYFFVNPNTGVVTLLVSVDNLNVNLFRVTLFWVWSKRPLFNKCISLLSEITQKTVL